MIKDLDIVALTQDIREYSLKKGDIGAVVHCYTDGEAYEVEFVTGDGRSIAVLRLNMSHIRLMSGTEILHVREVSCQAS